ncbi:hypothetical protein C8Q77DRAFT_1100695 [Trametes polyzona]|nr:hypothetical protein C8Q77DRAFT_1100695 [Trametes polyzona]
MMSYAGISIYRPIGVVGGLTELERPGLLCTIWSPFHDEPHVPHSPMRMSGTIPQELLRVTEDRFAIAMHISTIACASSLAEDSRSGSSQQLPRT